MTRGFASGVTKEEAENEKIEKAEALTLASMMDKWLIVGAIFSLDSSSSSSSGGQGLSTIYNENLAGFHAGVRVRPFAAQSFVLYVLGGTQKDLRGTTQHRAKWFSELIAGVNGYWAWGPGKEWLESDLEEGGLSGKAPQDISKAFRSWSPRDGHPFEAGMIGLSRPVEMPLTTVVFRMALPISSHAKVSAFSNAASPPLSTPMLSKTSRWIRKGITMTTTLKLVLASD